jgi:hypothetical protein
MGSTKWDYTSVKLGKKAPRIDARTLKMAKYLAPDISPAPPALDYSRGLASWGMMANDSLGDCTIAAIGHAFQVVTLNTTGIVTLSDADIIKYYSWFCGYVPGDPSTDQGGVELDVLNNWRKWGVGGHAMLAYAAPAPGNAEHIRKAVELFGFVYIGLGLPITAQSQVGGLWDVVGNPQTDPNSQPGSWGGHAVVVVAYDAETLTVITWGALQKMTWAFWQAYVDESYALVLGYRVGVDPEPAGFTMSELIADLAVVTG